MNIITIILAGGQGSRLMPLTKYHCKPAIPFGGRYRLIDIPISNSLNSGMCKMYVLAQYHTKELLEHIDRSYHCDKDHFIELLEPTSVAPKHAFNGTVDCIRKKIDVLAKTAADYFLILSGDQLYNIDFNEMVKTAVDTKADLVVASFKAARALVPRLGILQVDDKNRIFNFSEKPCDDRAIEELKCDDFWLASMGIYVIKGSVLQDFLQYGDDFGKNVIPHAITTHNVYTNIYEGYWEDIGTIDSFYKANLSLIEDKSIDTYDEKNPILTHMDYLPGSRFNNAIIDNSIIADGSVVNASRVCNSIIGVKTNIGNNAEIASSLVMGSFMPHKRSYIGDNCVIKNAILGENVNIGNGVSLINKAQVQHFDGDNVFIRNGIIIVGSHTAVADGFVL